MELTLGVQRRAVVDEVVCGIRLLNCPCGYCGTCVDESEHGRGSCRRHGHDHVERQAVDMRRRRGCRLHGCCRICDVSGTGGGITGGTFRREDARVLQLAGNPRCVLQSTGDLEVDKPDKRKEITNRRWNLDPCFPRKHISLINNFIPVFKPR